MGASHSLPCLQTQATTLPYTVEDPLPNCILVFDNKGEGEHKPRLGIVRAGAVDLVLEGDSSVLKAHDLESISLVDAARGLYVAVGSQGDMHVFTLHQSTDHEYAGNQFMAQHVAKGQLPVPEGESTKSWMDANRTNIEATRYIPSGSPCLRHLIGDTSTGVFLWGARGGQDYAGVKGGSSSVWLRWAPFDAASATVDEAKMGQSSLPNLGETGAWRALSAVDVSGDVLYFTAAFDGEEEGHDLDMSDAKRKSTANRRAFRSLVGSKHLGTGECRVLGSFAGFKAEALCKLDDATEEAKAPSGGSGPPRGAKQFLMATDDEQLGCLLAKIYVCAPDGGGGGAEAVLPNPIFRDFGAGATARYPRVAGKCWGTSGAALLATVAMPPPSA